MIPSTISSIELEFEFIWSQKELWLFGYWNLAIQIFINCVSNLHNEQTKKNVVLSVLIYPYCPKP